MGSITDACCAAGKTKSYVFAYMFFYALAIVLFVLQLGEKVDYEDEPASTRTCTKVISNDGVIVGDALYLVDWAKVQDAWDDLVASWVLGFVGVAIGGIVLLLMCCVICMPGKAFVKAYVACSSIAALVGAILFIILISRLNDFKDVVDDSCYWQVTGEYDYITAAASMFMVGAVVLTYGAVVTFRDPEGATGGE